MRPSEAWSTIAGYLVRNSRSKSPSPSDVAMNTASPRPFSTIAVRPNLTSSSTSFLAHVVTGGGGGGADRQAGGTVHIIQVEKSFQRGCRDVKS